ncbi:hypothetical protein FD755_008258, partial [Muntiacus reevesi]
IASAAREGAGSGRRRPPPRRALPGLLLLCLWLPGGRAAGSPSAPLSELHAQLSGVEQLLEEFRRQLQQERPQEELELELRAGGDPQEGCPGPGGGGYRARPDAIIRTKDSIAAGASFLSAPAAVRDWRQCLQACCLEPRCSVAVVELPRRLAPQAAALGCYLFNCTWRGRSVCKFALHRGYSSYSLSRAPEGEQEGLEAGAPALARASPRLGPQSFLPEVQAGGTLMCLTEPTHGCFTHIFPLCSRVHPDDHWAWSLFSKGAALLTTLCHPLCKPTHNYPCPLSHLLQGQRQELTWEGSKLIPPEMQIIPACCSQVALAVKNPPANAGDLRDSFIFLPGKSHGQRSLAGYSPWGGKELDPTEQLNTTITNINYYYQHPGALPWRGGGGGGGGGLDSALLPLCNGRVFNPDRGTKIPQALQQGTKDSRIVKYPEQRDYRVFY